MRKNAVRLACRRMYRLITTAAATSNVRPNTLATATVGVLKPEVAGDERGFAGGAGVSDDGGVRGADRFGCANLASDSVNTCLILDKRLTAAHWFKLAAVVADNKAVLGVSYSHHG